MNNIIKQIWQGLLLKKWRVLWEIKIKLRRHLNHIMMKLVSPKSDFKIVETIKHVHAMLQFMSVMTHDERYEQSYMPELLLKRTGIIELLSVF